MLREDLMNSDLLGEIVLLGRAALIVVALLLIVVAAFPQPVRWHDESVGNRSERCSYIAPQQSFAIDNPTA